MRNKKIPRPWEGSTHILCCILPSLSDLMKILEILWNLLLKFSQPLLACILVNTDTVSQSCGFEASFSHSEPRVADPNNCIQIWIQLLIVKDPYTEILKRQNHTFCWMFAFLKSCVRQNFALPNKKYFLFNYNNLSSFKACIQNPDQNFFFYGSGSGKKTQSNRILCIQLYKYVSVCEVASNIHKISISVTPILCPEYLSGAKSEAAPVA